MASKSFSYLKILEEDNADVTYKMTWDDLDLSLLPNNQMLNRYKEMNQCPLWDIDGSFNAMKEYSFVEDEICQFHVYAQKREDNNSEMNTHTRSMFCHLCNINIPATFIKNHMESSKHVNLLKLSNEVLSRTSKQLNEIFFIEKDLVIDKSYYCDTCNIIIKVNLKERHEKENIHLGALKRDQLMNKLIEIYLEDLDKGVGNGKVVKSSDVTIACINEPNNFNTSSKRAITLDITKDKNLKCDSNSPQSYVNKSGSKDTAKDKKGQVKISTDNKTNVLNSSLTNEEHQNVSKETVNIKKIQNHAKMSTEKDNNKINQENIDQARVAVNEVAINKSLDETETTNKFSIVDFDAEHYRVTALNGDVVKVSKTNWHRITKYSLDNDTTECFDCMLCQKYRLPIKTLKSHLENKKHRKLLLTPVSDKHSIIRFRVTQDGLFEYFCFLCNSSLLDEKLHKSTRVHKQNLDQALIFPKDTQAQCDTMNETKKTSSYFCEVCKVNVPNGSNNIALHNEGRPHKNNVFENMRTSNSKTTAMTQIALPESKGENISHIESSSTSPAASKSKHGLVKNDNLKCLRDINKKQENVFSETKQKENENSLNEAKESNSTVASKSKQRKKYLGEQTNPTKELISEIILKSKIEKKNQMEPLKNNDKVQIKESKQMVNKSLPREINESTGAAAASVKLHNSLSKDKNVVTQTKPSGQPYDFDKMQISENKQPTPNEVKQSSSAVAENIADENYLVVNQKKQIEQHSDITKTDKNDKNENEDTERGFPRELLEHSEELREIIYKVNDSAVAESIMTDFACLIDITTLSGDVLRISKLNYHGLTVAKWIGCSICDTEYEFVLFEVFLVQHITSHTHLEKLNNVTGNGLRKGRGKTKHCVVCNTTISSDSTRFHTTGRKHRELLAKALVDLNDINTEKNLSADESKAQDALRYSNIKSYMDQEVDYSGGDYISKLIRKSYRANDVSSYKLLQFLWSYIDVITVNDYILKLRVPYYHGIHIIHETDSYSCLLCQLHGRKVSLKSITDHIESDYHVGKLRIPIGDIHGMRMVQYSGSVQILHCALCNVNFDSRFLSQHINSLQHRTVFGRDPEPRLSPDPEPTPETEDTSRCVIS